MGSAARGRLLRSVCRSSGWSDGGTLRVATRTRPANTDLDALCIVALEGPVDSIALSHVGGLGVVDQPLGGQQSLCSVSVTRTVTNP